MRARILRGSHEVGGSCVEVEHAGFRIVLDVGKPLTAAWGEHVALPDVPGLADGSDPNLLAVLISHPHLDHYGLADQVSSKVPVYAGRHGAAIIEAASFFNPTGPVLSPSGYWRHRVPEQIGPFTVTPYLVDHSAYDAYALLIEAGQRRLFYSGDLRSHGRKGSLFEQLVADPPGHVDVLLLEGTLVARSSGSEATGQAGVCSETELEAELASMFKTTQGLVAVTSSAQNIDRLVTVYRAVRRTGRTLLVDLYGATVAAATGRATIPQPGFPALGVYVPNRQRVTVKASGEFHRTEKIRTFRVFPEQMAAHPGEYVLLSSGSTVPELLKCGALTANGLVIWSLWSGYLRQPSGQRLKKTLETYGVDIVEAHTSGHATVADLQRLVEAVDPRRVIPIHTDAPEGFSEFTSRARSVDDGDWWRV